LGVIGFVWAAVSKVLTYKHLGPGAFNWASAGVVEPRFPVAAGAGGAGICRRTSCHCSS